jgi:protein required for attachment to host cells
MPTTVILVADRAKARLVASDTGGRLAELACFVNPDARRPARELSRDRPPRVTESVGTHRHAIEPRTSVADKVSRRFARELVDALRHAHDEGRFTRLMLVAPPRFLGMLNAAIPKSLRTSVADELALDLGTLDADALHERLPKAWFAPTAIPIEAVPRNARRGRTPRRVSTTGAPRHLA